MLYVASMHHLPLKQPLQDLAVVAPPSFSIIFMNRGIWVHWGAVNPDKRTQLITKGIVAGLIA